MRRMYVSDWKRLSYLSDPCSRDTLHSKISSSSASTMTQSLYYRKSLFVLLIFAIQISSCADSFCILFGLVALKFEYCDESRRT